MPSIRNVRYQKQDEYGNQIFICNITKEAKSYKKLKNFSKQLKEKHPSTFLPIFNNTAHKYSTIRLKKDFKINNLKLKQNDVCDIKFSICSRSYENKTYLAAHCVLIKLVKRAPPIDLGVELELYDSDDSAAEESDESDDLKKTTLERTYRIPKVCMTPPSSPDPCGGHSHG